MKTHAPWIKSLEYQLVFFILFFSEKRANANKDDNINASLRWNDLSGSFTLAPLAR